MTKDIIHMQVKKAGKSHFRTVQKFESALAAESAFKDLKLVAPQIAARLVFNGRVLARKRA